MEININTALEALKNNVQNKVAELRGEQGIRGEKGDTGSPGRDAAPVKLAVGRVLQGKAGEEAAARIRQDGENFFILDLLLPCGQEGPRGLHGIGTPGPAGESPSKEDLKSLIREVVDENRERLRGPVGPEGRRGEIGATGAEGESPSVDRLRGLIAEVLFENREDFRGPQGEPGISVNDESLEAAVTNILFKVIGQDLVMQKLVAVRAELKRATHEMDSRHIAHVADVYRRVDRIIG